jgi:hypothetical protein
VYERRGRQRVFNRRVIADGSGRPDHRDRARQLLAKNRPRDRVIGAGDEQISWV